MGKSQAQHLADKLSDKNIQAIFSSPLYRAKETSEILNKQLQVEIIFMDEFKERNQNGFLSGMIRSEAAEKYPKETELLKDYRNTLPNSESYEDLGIRVKDGLDIIIKSEFQTIAAITHGGVLKNILREIFKVKDITKIEDCGFLEVDWDESEFKLINLFGIEVVA